MAPSSSSSPAFIKDEKVLCFHGELLYEAKVLDHKAKDPNDKKDGFMYRVHYKGWKNTYVSFLSFCKLSRECGCLLRKSCVCLLAHGEMYARAVEICWACIS